MSFRQWELALILFTPSFILLMIIIANPPKEGWIKFLEKGITRNTLTEQLEKGAITITEYLKQHKELNEKTRNLEELSEKVVTLEETRNLEELSEKVVTLEPNTNTGKGA